MQNEKFKYCCSDCGAVYPARDVMYLCPVCSEKNNSSIPPFGVLNVQYDYDTISAKAKGRELFRKLEAESFLPLLPINSLESLPNLRVGNTPLYKVRSQNPENKASDLFIKDDSQNPTFSFKDRASAVVSAWARENGINTIAAASTGNAGSSLAGICAAQGQKAIIFVPASAPIAKLTQIVMYGATIVPVEGTYDDAFDLCVAATEAYGFYNRNTAFNPLTIEGKKTVSLELYSQLGYEAPGRVYVPVGDGVIISGVFKGFEDLLKLGIIDQMPEIVAVQAEGSSNLMKNMESEEFMLFGSSTVADSISVDIPRNFRMAKAYLKKYNGAWVSVTDAEILEASSRLCKSMGIFSEPAAAAAYAGYIKYSQKPGTPAVSRQVVLLTGSGLKDLKSVQSIVSLPAAVKPSLDSLKHLSSL